MDFKKTGFVILLLCYFSSTAQVMNVRKWRPSERDSLNKGMELFDEKFFLQALPTFEALLKNHPDEEFLKYTYAKCALYRPDKHPDAYKYLTEVYEKNKKTPDIQYDMALASHYNYKFDEALDYANQNLKKANAEGKKNTDVLIRYINNAKYYYAKPTPAKIINLGSGINTADDEYVPAITADESKLIYTYAGVKSMGGRQADGNYFEDIYMSVKENGEFRTGVPVDSLNTYSPDAAISLSNDGSALFVYKDVGDSHGDLYMSQLNGANFSRPSKLKGEVNSYSWDGHCSISPDGRTIYFSSDRAGGYGGRDIYKATLQPDSTWGMVINLGDSINTLEDEDAPFIHSDGITLFYSSKGKTSMGGYDVFRAVMRPDDSTFKRVENLGYPINSPADDIYFVLSANGNTGYYSSAKNEGYGLKDIYKVEPNFADFKPVLYLVKGTVKSDGTPVEADIKVQMSSKSNRLFKSLRSNSNTGEYLVTVPAGVNYAITYAYNGKEETYNVDAVDLNGFAEKIHDVNFVGAPIAANTNTIPPVAVKTETVNSTTTLASNEPPKESAGGGAKEPVKDPFETNTKPATSPEPVVSKPIASNAKPAETEKPKAAETEKPKVSEPVATTTKPASTEPEKPKVSEPVASNTKPAKTVEPEKTNLPETKAVAAAEPETKTALGTTSISEPKIMRSRNSSAGSAVDFTARPVTSTPLPPELANETFNLPSKESFKAVNGPQIKSMRFAEKHNNESAQDLEFLVQVAAIKNDKNVILPNQDVLGNIEKLDLNDGYIRIVVGGSFRTVGAALAHNKKVVKAGQKEGFIIVIYKGQRITYEELEKLGVLKK